MRRDVAPRSFWAPKDAVRIGFKDIPGGEVFYKGRPSGTGLTAVGFAGRAQKPQFSYSFRDWAQFQKFVTKWHAEQVRVQKVKADNRAALKSDNRLVKVGDIFTSSWGYDQTNVYFYQVVDLRGSATAVLQRIGTAREYNGPMTGDALPSPEHRIGEPITKRVQVNTSGGASTPYFRMESYEYAYKWDGKPKRFSEYH